MSRAFDHGGQEVVTAASMLAALLDANQLDANSERRREMDEQGVGPLPLKRD